MAVMFMSEPEKKSKSMRKAFPDFYSDMFLHLFNKYSGHLLNTYSKIIQLNLNESQVKLNYS